jgi:hypothetical protein
MDHEVLKDMPAIEQWNYLVLDCPGFQLAEKYGVKYRTYNK